MLSAKRIFQNMSRTYSTLFTRSEPKKTNIFLVLMYENASFLFVPIMLVPKKIARKIEMFDISLFKFLCSCNSMTYEIAIADR